MILFKCCPRCHGDMMQEELLGETEFVCLQCGHRTYPEAPAKQPAERPRIARAA